MPSECTQPFTSPLPQHEFVQAACHALVGLGYRPSANAKLGEIVASFNQTRRVAGGTSSFEFSATISWTCTELDIQATLSIREEKSGRQDRCFEHVEKFLTKLNGLTNTALARLLTETPSTRYGSARWGTTKDLVNQGFLSKDVQASRLLLAKQDGGYVTVPPLITNAHAAVIGPAGRGKSTGIFVPNIIERIGTSMIITEATNAEGEQADIFKRTAGYRGRAGHHIYWFNPTLQDSTRINPIDCVREAPQDRRVSEAEKLANLISKTVQTTGVQSQDHWDKSAYMLLVALIMHVAEGIEEPKYKHLGTILRLLEHGPDGLNHAVGNSRSQAAKRLYNTFSKNNTEGHCKGVISTVLPKLLNWINNEIVALTCTSDVTINQLSQQMYTFYLSVPAARDDLKPLTALVLNYLLGVLQYRPFPHPLTFLLDEFTNFGAIPSFTSIYSTIRKTGVAFLLGFQSENQLEGVYRRNDAKTILDNTTTKIYLKPAPKDNLQATGISKALGSYTKVEYTNDRSGHVIEKEYGRQLMTEAEVVHMDADKAIVFTEGLPPLLIDKIPPAAYEYAGIFPLPKRPAQIVNVEDITLPLPEIKLSAKKDSSQHSQKSAPNVVLDAEYKVVSYDEIAGMISDVSGTSEKQKKKQAFQEMPYDDDSF